MAWSSTGPSAFIGKTVRMTILVTGGAGYIGSHAVRLLGDRGRDVVVLDSMEFGHRAAVGDAPLVEADIADDEAVKKVVSQFDVDAVMHFGGYKAAGESMEQPGRYFHNNVFQERFFDRDSQPRRRQEIRFFLKLCRVRDSRASPGQ